MLAESGKRFYRFVLINSAVIILILLFLRLLIFINNESIIDFLLFTLFFLKDPMILRDIDRQIFGEDLKALRGGPADE